MRRVYAREEVCISCKLCEVGCAVEHSESKHIITAMRREDPKPVSRIHVEVDGPISFALQCRHCEDPHCVQSCLTQALRQGSDGVVRYNPDYCMACYTCLLACPNGAIVKSVKGTWKGVAKCDLCPDLEVPACVTICPNEALIYAEEWEFEALLARAETRISVEGGHHG